MESITCSDLKLYRKRYIPNEIVYLKDDIIFYSDDKLILTKWNVLKPRLDFAYGESCYYLDMGIKISRMYDSGERLLYHYCDIIEVEYDKKNNSVICNDLLADVIIYNDGFVKVVDLGEISEALDKELITPEQAKKALNTLDYLLGLIYSGRLVELTGKFEIIKETIVV